VLTFPEVEQILGDNLPASAMKISTLAGERLVQPLGPITIALHEEQVMNLRLSLLLALAMMTSCSGQRVNSSKALPHDSSTKSRESEQRASQSTEGDIGVVQDFVQEFYSWYVPVTANSHSGRPSDLALRTRPSAFDASLARQLKEDSDAQAKVVGDIVGFDFDPFLAAQDLCERYEVVNVQPKADSYMVGVRGVGGCKKHDEVDVIAEVASRNGASSFVNFHYPGIDNSDLLTILKRLRDDRR